MKEIKKENKQERKKERKKMSNPRPHQRQRFTTFVIPRTPIFGLEEVDPFPVPKTPSSTQEMPSTNIPLMSQKRSITDTSVSCWPLNPAAGALKTAAAAHRLMAWTGGGGAQERRAQAQQSPIDSMMLATTALIMPITPAAVTVGVPHWTADEEGQKGSELLQPLKVKLPTSRKTKTNPKAPHLFV